MTLHIGHVLDVLPTLPAESVQCCVTSPPYWGLRDYGTARWEGGSDDCDHMQHVGGTGRSTLALDSGMSPEAVERSIKRSFVPYRDVCGKCGARRVDQQIGLEKTLEEYVETMVRVFAEVRRVLRPDGALWVNLGDSYVSNPASQDRQHGFNRRESKQTGSSAPANATNAIGGRRAGLKPKDLVGIPWRVALALQADGWYLRQDIIWHKPNPMPESVRDRCTKAHEYLFMLTRSERYCYDAEAIAEPLTGNAHPRGRGANPKAQANAAGSKQNESFSRAITGLVDARNRRSVWTIPTKPYPEAHFAVFPPDLVEPCILATSRTGDVVLDPFMGSGTTAQVAQALGREWVGVELNPNYAQLIERRTQQMGLAL